MKNTKPTLMLILVFLLAGIVSCTKEETVSSKPAPTKQLQAVAYVSCESQCIEPGSGDYYYKSGSVSGAVGGNTKSISYTVYNTETDFVVVLTYNRTPASSGASSTIKVTVNGSDQTKTIANNGSATYTFPLASGWDACDATSWSLVETVYDGASALSTSGTYNLIGLCGCQYEGNSFTGAAVSCGSSREANYAFTTEDGVSSFKMQGGLTNFTSGTPVVTVTGGSGISVTYKQTGSDNSNYVYTITGAVSSCSAVNVNIKWNSTNSGSVITGDWSVSAGDYNGSVSGLTCQ